MLAGCTLLLLPAASAAEPPTLQGTQAQTLKRLSLEQLMEIDVTSVSRRPERRIDTAAAVSVITAEEIRRAGVSTLPDALRLAGGLFVGRFDAGTWAISSRGFASNVVNKMLVLIDGRSMYTPLFGGVFWDAQDTLLADVERIEVIHGPAGTLWGANAVNGVINIITRRANETPGTLLRLGAGTREAGVGAIRYGGRIGDGAYRVYAKTGFWDSPRRADGGDAREDRRMHQAGFRSDWGASEDGVTISGDLSYGRRGLFDRPDLDFWSGNLLGRWLRPLGNRSTVQVRGYVDRAYRQVPEQSWEERTTYDIEAQQQLSADRHRLVWGGGYRLSKDRTRDTPLIFFRPAHRTVSISNVFVEDEMALRPARLFLTLGTKVEHNTYSGWDVAPNVRLRARLADRTTAWAAVSRAVRTPTRFDRDLNVTVAGQLLISGNTSFVSEKLVSYEAGVRHAAGTRLAVNVSAFFNSYDDLRTQEPTPPAGFPLILANGANAKVTGFEIDADLQAHERWLVNAGVSVLDFDRTLDPESRDVSGGVDEANDPGHQFWARSYLDLGRGFEADALLRAIGELTRPFVPGYTELDLRVGWRTERVFLSIIGRDLLHDRHPEFGAPGPGRREFQREVVARATLLF